MRERVTPWEQANAQRRSRQQEEGLAREPGGSKQINSGRTWHSKGDVRLGEFLVETKTTEKASFSITEKNWAKIEAEAHNTPNMPLPAMQIDLPSVRLFTMRLTDHQEREARIAFLEEELRGLRGVSRAESETE